MPWLQVNNNSCWLQVNNNVCCCVRAREPPLAERAEEPPAVPPPQASAAAAPHQRGLPAHSTRHDVRHRDVTGKHNDVTAHNDKTVSFVNSGFIDDADSCKSVSGDR